MSMAPLLLGCLAGMAIAMAIAIAIPSLGFVGGVLLGFGMTALGGMIGSSVDR